MAHSIRRMIRDNTPGERERPTTPPEQTEVTDVDTGKPRKPTLWESGIKTHPQTAQGAGSSKAKTPKDREQHKLTINAKDKLTTGKTEPKTEITETETGEESEGRNKRKTPGGPRK